MIFLSKEWLDAYSKALKKNKKYQREANGYDSLFQFICEPSPEKGITEVKACGLLLPQATETWMGVKEDVDYTMTASYETFYKIAIGKLGPILAITTRKARIAGNFPKMMKYTAGTNMAIEILKKIPTEFEGDFS